MFSSRERSDFPAKFELFNLSSIIETSGSVFIILESKCGCATVTNNAKQIEVSKIIPTAILLYFLTCKLNNFADNNNIYIIKVELKIIISLEINNNINESIANNATVFTFFKCSIFILAIRDTNVIIYVNAEIRFKSIFNLFLI